MNVWTVSVANAGTLTQCLGVAHHFSSNPHRVIVKKRLRRWSKGWLSPYRHLEAADPDLIISCGSKAPAHVMAIVASCRHKPFTVHLQPPEKERAEDYDLVFVGRHDWSDWAASQPNFRSMIGAPNEVTSTELKVLRNSARSEWAGDGGAVVTVLIGGPTQAFTFDSKTTERLLEQIRSLASNGWNVLVSTSRRTPPDLLMRLLSNQTKRLIVWDHTGPNPYRQFLAAADAFLITEDSVTMISEALATGRPVYTFRLPTLPSVKLEKFKRLHCDMMQNLQLIREFDGELLPYHYTPLDEAKRIAGLIRQAIAGGQ